VAGWTQRARWPLDSRARSVSVSHLSLSSHCPAAPSTSAQQVPQKVSASGWLFLFMKSKSRPFHCSNLSASSVSSAASIIEQKRSPKVRRSRGSPAVATAIPWSNLVMPSSTRPSQISAKPTRPRAASSRSGSLNRRPASKASAARSSDPAGSTSASDSASFSQLWTDDGGKGPRRSRARASHPLAAAWLPRVCPCSLDRNNAARAAPRSSPARL